MNSTNISNLNICFWCNGNLLQNLVVPSKVRLPLSSNTPPVPITTLPDVKLSDTTEETYAVAAFTVTTFEIFDIKHL